MTTGQNTQSSNSVGISIAEEATPKVLPGSPVWFGREANSFPDFGAEAEYTRAEVISSRRTNREGNITGIDAVGGYNINMSNALQREAQGFFVADAYEQTDTLPLNGAQISITDVDGSGVYAAASGLDAFAVGALVFAEDFTNPANNGFGRVTTAIAAALTIDGIGTVAEPAPPARAKVKRVGHQFGTGDLAITVSPGRVVMTSTADAWANLPLQVGQWLFIGGDAVATRYDSGYGYGRVESYTNGVVVLDNLAWAGGSSGADTGAGKTIQVFTGTWLKDETDQALQICRTYQLERTLGNDGNGIQSEIVTGAFANTFTGSFPLRGLHSSDIGFVALDDEQRTGTDGLKAGARVPYPSQTPYSTSTSVWRLGVAILDETTVTPTGLFGFASEATMTIDNGATAVPAIGLPGGIDITTSNFTGGGSVSAYFQDIAARTAVKTAAKLGYDVIKAAGNKGIVYDMPQCRAQGGRLAVAANDPITIPYELFAEENVKGYTASMTFFDYLPNIAMPVV